MSDDRLDANGRRDERDVPAATCCSAAPGPNGHPAAPPLLAVVDDDEAIRRSMHRVLRAAGYCVREFARGADFIESLRSTRPACVLLDLEMPGLTGFDVLDHLARLPVRVPAIIVTGRDTPQYRQRAAAGGAAGYFSKPVDPTPLLAAIAVAIAGSPESAGTPAAKKTLTSPE